jgi:tuberous sclerosis 2
MSDKLRVLNALTNNGRDLSPFETDMGDVCTGWLSNHFDKMRPDDVKELLGLICKAVAYVPSFLSTENKTLLLQRACVVTTSLRSASQVPVVEACLGFLEAVVQHGLVLPPNCLSPMVASICCTVNVEKLCDVSWRVGRGLLSSHGYSVETLDALCSILQSQGIRAGQRSAAPTVQNAGSIIRGAVFFVAMSCWGKDKIETLRAAPLNILAAFVLAVRSGYSVAAYEVLLSVRRLIRKQGSELVVEWDNIFVILHELAAYTSSNASFVRVLIDTLNSLRALSDTNRFAADPQRLLWLLEAHASVLPARESLRLLRTRLNQVQKKMLVVFVC